MLCFSTRGAAAQASLCSRTRRTIQPDASRSDVVSWSRFRFRSSLGRQYQALALAGTDGYRGSARQGCRCQPHVRADASHVLELEAFRIGDIDGTGTRVARLWAGGLR
jgi:hypothetical protein